MTSLEEAGVVELARAVSELSRDQAKDPNSLAMKNVRSLPKDLFGEVLVLFADIGAVLVLDQAGRFRGFAHATSEEVPLSDTFKRVARRELGRQFPVVADLLEEHQDHSDSAGSVSKQS